MIKSWLQLHPLLGYFILAFGISWGLILVNMASRGFDLTPLQKTEGGTLFFAMLLGPSVSGLICTAILEGQAGLRKLCWRLLHWRVAVRWYVVALLISPAILLIILTSLSILVEPAFAPRFQWSLFALGLLAGVFEEIGWTAFATPRLLVQGSVVHAGLILGLVWASWHLLVDWRYNAGAMGAAVWPMEFVITYLMTLTPYRVLMTWIYSHTQSVLLAVLMHASLTGSLLVLVPIVPQSLGFYWQVAFASVLVTGIILFVQLVGFRNLLVQDSRKDWIK
jgi:uncharacterized protein